MRQDARDIASFRTAVRSNASYETSLVSHVPALKGFHLMKD